MGFPNALRVIYEHTPSQEVISQVRFPGILKIDSESPSAFQDRIRDDFPFYHDRPALKIPEGVPAELAGVMIPLGGQMSHNFTSKDSQWTVGLTREFLALTCRPYDRWESFRRRFNGLLDALTDVYRPPFFTRIGLRYQDVIRRSKLGLNGCDWNDLLEPWIAGAFTDPRIAHDIEHSARELHVRLPHEQSHVRVHHGTAMDAETKEILYVFDADFFCDQQMEPTDALKCLDFLNQQARLFFRWCIKDRLHDAMGPIPV